MQVHIAQSGVLASQAATDTKIIIGEEVYAMLDEEEFQAKWDTLYEICPWATVFQSREFVSNWYNAFNGCELPIMVIRERATKLEGLLTMTLSLSGVHRVIRKSTGIVMGAGRFDAEYQTWLASKETCNSFIQEALILLRSDLPRCHIRLRYIPAKTPVNWAEPGTIWHRRVVLQSFSRPLIEIRSPMLEKKLRSGHVKTKLNRLKKLGTLEFDQITDREEFATILPKLATMFDFRQQAMFNKLQFKNNPRKADLLLRLFNAGILHVTVLKIKGDIMASIAAVEGRDWVHLGGINVHAPFNAYYYSPGLMHFYLLWQFLNKKSNVKIFDLTPGGDLYKERLATCHDQVYELIMAANPMFKLKKVVKKNIQNYLIRAGKRPMSVELALKKKIYTIYNKISVSKILGKIQIPEQCLPSSVAVKLNDLEDLLLYEGSAGKQARWDFLQEAMGRLENGQCCYTWSADTRLLACAWCHAPSPKSGTPATTQPPQDAYCHPLVRDRLEEFLAIVNQELVEKEKQEHPGQ